MCGAVYYMTKYKGNAQIKITENYLKTYTKYMYNAETSRRREGKGSRS